MTKAKHTDGPWTVESSNEGGFVIEKDGYLVIASRGPHEKRANEMLANARLIAAAPELLAALEGFLAMYIAAANSGDWGNWNPEEDPEVIAARAAISKATGEQA
jgi:hypothetical protein